MKKIFKANYGIVLILSLVVASCNLDDGVDTVPIPDSNLVDVASDNAELTSLISALQRADLVSTLEGSTLYTVLAPTNTAFSGFLSQAGFSSIEDVPVATLRQILLNHVLVNRVDSAVLANLQKNYVQTSADGPSSDSKLSLYFDATDGVVFNGSATVTTADIPASNGLIHIVDNVIGLPTLETFLSADDNFDSLDTALDVVSPSTDLPTTLSEDSAGPFTVFAPVNQAFDDLLATNDDWNFISDIDEMLLISVLAHHVVNGNLPEADLDGLENETTLEGDDIQLGKAAGVLQLTDGSGNSDISVVATNVQATNGVIHLINKVMLPNTDN